MKNWIAFGGLTLCVLILELRTRPEPRVESAPAQVTAIQPKTVVPEPERVVSTTVNDTWDVTAAHRNLFTYADAPKRQPQARVAVHPKPLPQPDTPPAVAATPEIPIRRDPEMSFHYAGSFGPANDPIAVFTRDGEVVNARAGDNVEAFRIERVQFKGVDVRAPVTATVKTLPNRP